MSLTKKNVPYVTINRLCIYHRCLEKIIEAEGKKESIFISSSEIAAITGINSIQIRKDLAYFGEFGKRGTGYPVLNLVSEFDSCKQILGI